MSERKFNDDGNREDFENGNKGKNIAKPEEPQRLFRPVDFGNPANVPKLGRDGYISIPSTVKPSWPFPNAHNNEQKEIKKILRRIKKRYAHLEEKYHCSK